MKRLIILIFGLIFLTNFCSAQDYFSNFQKSLTDNDTIRQWEILQKWEKENPQDAELFISYFNSYFNKSRNEILIVSAGNPPQGENYYALSDSLGNYAGFMCSQINYDDAYLKKGLEKIDEGIKLYPNRLDMRFGKIYAFGQIKDWQSFTNEIIKTINYSAITDNQWSWTNNEPLENGKEFFLSSLQDYQFQLYNTKENDLIPFMQEIAKTVLTYYPNHIESLSNLAIGYLIAKEYDNTLEYLLKAEKINAKDYIVLLNIAYAYREKGEKNKAIDYYKKVIDYGDEEAKNYAKEEIENLKK